MTSAQEVHPVPSTKVWKFVSHKATAHVVDAAPSQSVQDPSTTPTISFMTSAQEVLVTISES